MTTIPDAAIEAAAEAIWRTDHPTDPRRFDQVDLTEIEVLCVYARAAIEAAMPAIRKHIAQEIEVKITKPKSIWDDDGHHRQHNYKEAARIVRGGDA